MMNNQPRPRVYISGPVTKGDRNMNFAQAAAAEKQLMLSGMAPFNPMRSMIMPHAWDGELPHSVWLECDLLWVSVCGAVYRLPGESAGADEECQFAMANGIDVLTSVKDLISYFSLDRENEPNDRAPIEWPSSIPTAVSDGDTVTNEFGGKQSHVTARLDLIPHDNELLLGECLGFGANKYGEDNWKKIPLDDNLNHALVHIRKYLAGDREEQHLVNTLARVNFALWHAIESDQHPRRYIHPDMLKAGQDTNGLIESKDGS